MAKTKSTTKAKTGKQKLAAAAPSAPNIDIGITQGDRKKIADGLSRFQADAFTLYLKTHNFHWNVTGSMFNSLHTMFETQYTEQWAALDDVAERIRALGFNAPGSYREFAALGHSQRRRARGGRWRGTRPAQQADCQRPRGQRDHGEGAPRAGDAQDGRAHPG